MRTSSLLVALLADHAEVNGSVGTSDERVHISCLVLVTPKPDVNRLEAGNRLSVSERTKEAKLKG